MFLFSFYSHFDEFHFTVLYLLYQQTLLIVLSLKAFFYGQYKLVLYFFAQQMTSETPSRAKPNQFRLHHVSVFSGLCGGAFACPDAL